MQQPDSPVTIEQALREEIARRGPMPVDDYMRRCVSHYYGAGRAFGREGDFVTAPEISQIFGELMGLWCAIVWRQMGEPAAVRLVEMGPGRGTMMADMLRAARVLPGFLAAVRVHLVEASPALQDLQRSTLTAHADTCSWHAWLDDIPPGPAILVANEFLDALPVRQLVRRGEGWRERAVGIDDNNDLCFVDLDTPTGCPHADRESIKDGAVVETRDYSEIGRWLAARAASKVAALFIDYGHTVSSTGDTLQAVRNHAFEDVLASPGAADLTAHVDFAEFADAVRDNAGALTIDGPVTQAALLSALGISERAARLMSANPAAANSIEMSVGRLLSPSGMGTRFKAIGIRSTMLPPLPALASI